MSYLLAYSSKHRLLDRSCRLLRPYSRRMLPRRRRRRRLGAGLRSFFCASLRLGRGRSSLNKRGRWVRWVNQIYLSIYPSMYLPIYIYIYIRASARSSARRCTSTALAAVWTTDIYIYIYYMYIYTDTHIYIYVCIYYIHTRLGSIICATLRLCRSRSSLDTG